MDHPGSKTRSVGQIIEKLCEHSRGHSFGPIFIKLAQNDHLGQYLSPSSNMGDVGSKTRSVGHFIEKPSEHSRSHSFGPIFIELDQDIIWIILSQKLGQKVKSQKNLVNTLEATVLVQSSSNLLSNMGHVGSKTGSVGQIALKPSSPS